AGPLTSAPTKWTIACRAVKYSSGVMNLFGQLYHQVSPAKDWASYYLRVGSGTNMGFTVSNSYSYLNTGEPSLNVLHQFVGVYDGSSLYYYLDGVLQASGFTGGSAGTPDYSASAEMTAGILASYRDHPWDGVIEQVLVYDRAWSAGDVLFHL